MLDVADRRRVAILTGCSSGFGLLSAVELAGVGFRVYATMRNPSKRDGPDRAASEAGVSVEVLPLDVTRDESVASAFDRIQAEAGRVDVRAVTPTRVKEAAVRRILRG